MKKWRDIADVRREYGELQLTKASIAPNPFDQFKHWFEEITITEKSDPTAMVLSTIDEKGHPDSRVVLLKGIDAESFIFFTNYESSKGLQLKHNPYAALNFYWPETARQVRIRGQVSKVSNDLSDEYFATRPIESQLSAIASPQSNVIASREYLTEKLENVRQEYTEKVIKRPQFWGGYAVIAEEMEFWQGRDNRLHDRFLYIKENENWVFRRLAP